MDSTDSTTRAAMTQAVEDWSFSRSNSVRNPGKVCCAPHGNPIESCAKTFRPGVTCQEHYATLAAHDRDLLTGVRCEIHQNPMSTCGSCRGLWVALQNRPMARHDAEMARHFAATLNQEVAS